MPGDAHRQHQVQSQRRIASATVALSFALCATGLPLAGCRDALFPKNSNRTQFDDYDRLRGTYVPQKKPDRTGVSRPAVRERLERLRGS